jgi:thiol-disulfide isomerase/thioredoxin
MKNLFTLIFSLVTVGLFAQTVYFKESLEDGLPESWTVEGEWAFGSNTDLSSDYFAITDIGRGNLAAFNDDGNGNGHVGDGTVTTAPIDLTMVEGTVFLEMFSFFLNGDYQGANERAIINISTNGGDSFDVLTELEATGGFEAINVDISAFAGQTIQLQFLYSDGAGWNFGWALDEITIADEITLIERRNYLISAGSSTIINNAEEGIDYIHEGFIINNGLDPITSYDVVMSDGTNSMTKSYTGISVERGGFHKYKMDESVVVEGNKEYTVQMTNVNGDAQTDLVLEDNSATFLLNAYSALNSDRGILAEEATGTWCPWCPRGTVNMDELSKRFPNNFVGIAVHNADPMADVAYDNAITTFDGFSGFPSVVLERNSIIDPGDLPAQTIPMMNVAPPAGLTVGAEVSGNTITTSIQVDFLTDVSDAHNVSIIIAENGVTGSDADRYFQTNNYAGGGVGPMGGYELLPSTVPASFNEFNHVGRTLIGGYEGTDEALDAAEYTTGSTDGWVFDAVTLPADVDMNNLYVVGLLTNRATGEVVNATQASILDAASNGLFDNVSTRDIFDATLAEVFPNPVSDMANIVLNLDNAADVNITVINSLGQTVAVRSYDQQVGTVSLQQDMSSFAEGMYMINITAGDRFITKKINKVN